MRQNSVRRVRTVATLAAAALLLSAFPAFASEESQGASFDAAAFEAEDIAPGLILVTTAEANDTAFASALSSGADVTQIASRSYAVKVDEGSEVDVAAQVAQQSGVLTVGPSGYGTTQETPDDEYYDLQWAHEQVGAEDAWDLTTGSSDVTIAIADTGMDTTHSDISRVTEQVKFTHGEQEDGVDGNNDRWDDGHGQHVGGIAAADTDNGTGVAGVDWNANILDADIFDEYDDVQEGAVTTLASVAASISWATESGADVVNLSIGGAGSCDPTVQNAVDDASAAGTAVVVSSGNAGEQGNPIMTPADCDGVITVGATGPEGERAPYSSFTEHVDVAAPGGDLTFGDEGGIASTWNVNSDADVAYVEGDEEYAFLQGTSMAAPYVTGLVALGKAVNPEATTESIYDCLTATAVHPDGEERDDEYGHGLVDATAFVECVAEDAPEPPDERRIYDGSAETDPVDQAVAASQEAFGGGEATHAVVAQYGDYSDALAGSTLTLGSAPVLYTESEGGLPDATAEELSRVLDEGGDVYVLGGSAAISDETVTDLEDLGYAAERVVGPTRGETAEEVAYTVAELVEDAEGVALAKAFDWPDAITAGSVGAQLDYPVLVTGYGEEEVDELHESAARALELLDPDYLITVGGTSAIGEEAEREAADIGDVPEENITRLGGGSRLETAIEVGDFLVEHLDDDPVVYGVNVRSQDGYAHVLSTSANLVQGGGGIYVPFEGDDGSRYTDDDTTHVREWVQGLPFSDAYAVGGQDVIVDESVDAFFSDLGLE